MENEKALEGFVWLCLIEWSATQSKASQIISKFCILYLNRLYSGMKQTFWNVKDNN